MYKHKSKTKPRKNRYILYARKSTTSEDRQVASIESQIEVMQETAKEHDLQVVKVMSESGSGFKIGRPVFNQMIEMIENGEAEGIVVWKLSRLSRNPDDAGKIMGLLQRGEIKHIRTVERNWNPEDNVMMMYVEFGLTNQFSRDLSTDTRRGLTKKAERGWVPNAILHLGYKHTPYKALGDEEIIIDDDKFYLMQKGLKLVASRRKTPVQALEHLQGLGLTGRKGKPLSPSTWYSLLSEPLYSGTFEFPKGSGEMHESKAVKAITQEEFDSIQAVLGRKNKPRPKKHFLPYTGLMVCGECGSSITAEKKRKVQKNGNVHHYTYYRCTKKKGHCGQKFIRVGKLETQYKDLLFSIRIPKAFHEWALEEIRKDQEKEVMDRSQSLEKTRTRYDGCVKKIDDLVEGYLDKKIPEENYERKLAEYEKEKKTLKKILDDLDLRIDERIKKLDKDLGFAVTASRRFKKGKKTKRREIVSYLGSNLILTNQTLDIELKRPLKRIQKEAKEIRSLAKRFEPLEKADNSAKFKEFLSQNPVGGG